MLKGNTSAAIKRYRLFLDLWRNTDSKANPDLFESYLQQLYGEQARIQELDRQRHTTFSDLVQLPWIGNFVS